MADADTEDSDIWAMPESHVKLPVLVQTRWIKAKEKSSKRASANGNPMASTLQNTKKKREEKKRKCQRGASKE